MSRRAIGITKTERQTIAVAIGSTKAFFRKGRITSLVKGELLSRFAGRWANRQIHGGVKEASRAGYAIASSDMTRLAHGLLSARYATLAANKLPQSKAELVAFLGGLIVKNRAADPAAFANCASLIIEEFERGSGQNYTVCIEQIANSLFRIREFSDEFYTYVLSGNIREALRTATELNDANIRALAFSTIAYCTQLWGGLDLQRSASCRRASRVSMIPFFMRPFCTTSTTAEYLNVMQYAASTMNRVFDADKLARRHERSAVRLRGPEGPLIDGVKESAQEIESDPKLKVTLDNLDPVRSQMLLQADITVDRCRDARPAGAGPQQTLHEHHFAGLTELAAFTVTAIRFVQVERELIKFVEAPHSGLDLARLLKRPITNDLEVGVISRARELVAAYRTAIIIDAHASADGLASDTSADDAFKLARDFLTKFDEGTTSPNDRNVMIDLDLSHWARCPPAPDDSARHEQRRAATPT